MLYSGIYGKQYLAADQLIFVLIHRCFSVSFCSMVAKNDIYLTKNTLGRCPLSVFSGLPGGSLGSRGLYEIDPGSVFDPRSSIDRISSALLPPLPPIHTQESLREDELQVGKYSFGVQLVCICCFAGPKECTSWRTRIGT